MKKNEYLRLFVELVLKINDFDFKNIIVDRERDAKEFGRIDLVIENSEKLLIIEMKIDACIRYVILEVISTM